MSGEESPKPKTRISVLLPLACVGLVGFAAATTKLYHSNRAFERKVDALVAQVEDLTRRLGTSEDENTTLRGKNKDLAAQNDRFHEEADAQKALLDLEQKRADTAEREAKAQKARADREKEMREAAEARAQQETKRADAEHARREELEQENTHLKEAEAEASRHNLGNALADLTRLENDLPRHAEEEDEARRHAYLRYDCSVMRRLAYDFTDGRGDEANARQRRNSLEERYSEACDEAR